jgi:hypothetical protein
MMAPIPFLPSAYVIEVSHLIVSIIGLWIAVVNYRADRYIFEHLDLVQSDAAQVLIAKWWSDSAAIAVVQQMVGLAVALSAVLSAPPPMFTSISTFGYSESPEALDFVRLASMVYGAVVANTLIVLIKSLERRTLRHRIMGMDL